MSKRLLLAIIVIVSVVFSLIGPAVVAAQPAVMARVLIGFDRPPGLAEEAIVHGVGGQI